jgi:hypothetical protein
MNGFVLALALLGQVMPETRHDVFGLDERLANIESKVDAVHDRLTSIERKLDEFELADDQSKPAATAPVAPVAASPPVPAPVPAAAGVVYYQAPTYYQAMPTYYQAAPTYYRVKSRRIFGARSTVCTVSGCY